MPTGYEVEAYRAIVSIAKSLEKIGAQLDKINTEGIKINKIEGLSFYHDSVPIIDVGKV